MDSFLREHYHESRDVDSGDVDSSDDDDGGDVESANDASGSSRPHLRKRPRSDSASARPPDLLRELPVRGLRDPHIYLSAAQRDACARVPSLRAYAAYLPGWLPHRVIATALGYTHECINRAVARLGGKPYVWATDFENVHDFWECAEPRLVIGGCEYVNSEAYFHAQKPRPWDAAAWDERRVDVMRTGIAAKLHASAAVRDILAATHNYPLLSIKNDTFWGFDPRAGGENMLARLWEELRGGEE